MVKGSLHPSSGVWVVKDFGIGFFGYVALCTPKDEMGWGYIVDPGFVMYDSLSSPEALHLEY